MMTLFTSSKSQQGTKVRRYEGKSKSIRAQYFKINDCPQAGLDKPSYVDTGTLIELPMTAFKGKAPVGKLTENDKFQLLEFLNNLI